MTGRQKIYQVLMNIRRESEINPSPEWVEFKFNNSIIGAGIMTDDQEKRILIKLEKEKILEIHLPDADNEEDAGMLSSYTPIEFMMQANSIWVNVLPLFHAKYFLYRLASLDENAWNIVNPFWILWQLVRSIALFIEWLWDRSKLATFVMAGVGGILVYDWSLAWRNIGTVLKFFKIL